MAVFFAAYNSYIVCNTVDNLPIHYRSELTFLKGRITAIHPADTTFVALRLIDGPTTTHSNRIGCFQRSACCFCTI